MIRSSKLSIKFANKEKRNNIKMFIQEYRNVVSFFIDCLWELDEIPNLLSKELTSKIETWLSARAIQCAGKQASGIVRGTKKKQEKRLYVYKKLLKQGFKKKAKKLKKHIDKAKISKPNLNHVNPELDSRFVKLDFANDTIFDGWVTLTSLGNKLKIQIPLKSTVHFNELKGELKKGIRLSNKQITLMKECEIEPKKNGKTVGLDIGSTTVASLSDNQVTVKDNHGHDLSSINKKLSRKKKGSKSFSKTQFQRKQYINWSINQLNFQDIKELKLENIKNLRRGNKINRYLNHWTYTEIKGKLEQKCEEFGVRVTYISPTYTSQRCSSCGWVRRSNRKGKLFKCDQCGFALDSDLNASRNIAAPLRPIRTKERLLHKNKNGFYWNEVSQESIVSDA